MTKAEEREKVEHDYLEQEGFKVDFGNLEMSVTTSNTWPPNWNAAILLRKKP